MKYLIGLTMLVVIAGSGCQKKEHPGGPEEPVTVQEQEPQESIIPLKFEFTVHKTGSSLSFKSAEGTEWKDLSYACKELPCEFSLNNYGVNTKVPATVFSIRFNLSAKEVNMTSVSMAPLKGSSWETLKYACETKECKFKVNQDGVTGV